MILNKKIVNILFLIILFISLAFYINGMVFADIKMRVKIDKQFGWILSGDLQLKQRGFILSAHSFFLADETNRQVIIDGLSIENSCLEINAKKGFLTRDFKEMRLEIGSILFYGFNPILSYKHLFIAGKTGFFIDGVLLLGVKDHYIGNGFFILGDSLVIQNMEKQVVYRAKKEKLMWNLFK